MKTDDDNVNKYDPNYVIECDRVKTRISRIALCPEDPSSLVVSTITGVDTFDVHHVRATRDIKKGISSFVNSTNDIDFVDGLYTVIQNSDNNYSGEKKRKEKMGKDNNNTDYHQYEKENNDSENGNCRDMNYISTPPEICVQIAVIPKETETENKNEISDNDNKKVFTENNLIKKSNKTIMNTDIIIGLSGKGKLYCGEILLVAGVSSFTLNIPLEVLMYVSTGTRPHLHFCSFESLRYVHINYKLGVNIC